MVRGADRRLRRYYVVGLIVVIGAYVRWAPLVPDLAAQVARADVIRDHGPAVWWTGWYGGISTPTYSVLAPSSMAVFGVRTMAAASVLVGCAACPRLLLRGSVRPRAGMVAYSAMSVADVLDGRVTFAIGAAIAMWALVALQSDRAMIATAASVLSFLASPLAGLFLGMVSLATAMTSRERRTTAWWCTATLLVAGVTSQIMFPGSGTMPYHWSDPIPAILACVVVILLCRQPVVRTASILTIVAMVGCFALPGAVGDNITRLAWVAATPTVVACASRSSRRLLVAGAALLVSIWPVSDLSVQMSASDTAAAVPTFYRAVSAELSQAEAAAGPTALGRRLEVVDPVNHWPSAYLTTFSLARGWDRQIDAADNPLFYKTGQLSATTYHDWLHEMAVGWIARPLTELDYAARAEAALIDRGLPYLQQVWTDRNWRVYRVTDATSLVTGGSVTALTATSVTLSVPHTPATVSVRMRWSPDLALLDPATGRPVSGCVEDVNGWIALRLTSARSVRVTGAFSAGSAIPDPDERC